MRTKALPTRQRNAVLWALASSLTLAAAALSVPPLRRLIEQSMVWHMVLQMPLLMLAGWVAAHAVGATNQSHSAPTKTSSSAKGAAAVGS